MAEDFFLLVAGTGLEPASRFHRDMSPTSFCTNKKSLTFFRKSDLSFVAGTGLEPATFGL